MDKKDLLILAGGVIFSFVGYKVSKMFWPSGAGVLLFTGLGVVAGATGATIGYKIAQHVELNEAMK